MWPGEIQEQLPHNADSQSSCVKAKERGSCCRRRTRDRSAGAKGWEAAAGDAEGPLLQMAEQGGEHATTWGQSMKQLTVLVSALALPQAPPHPLVVTRLKRRPSRLLAIASPSATCRPSPRSLGSGSSSNMCPGTVITCCESVPPPRRHPPRQTSTGEQPHTRTKSKIREENVVSLTSLPKLRPVTRSF